MLLTPKLRVLHVTTHIGLIDAIAKIDGSQVVVSSPAVPAPKYIRYAFRNDPTEANLSSKSGLTLIPFRTDDIPPPKW